MEKKLEPGNNVFIRVPENHECHGSNGILESIQGEMGLVEFGPEFAYMFDGKYTNECKMMAFELSKLERFELKDYPKIRA